MTDRAFVESYFARVSQANTAMRPHLPRLKALATGLRVAVEFGVKRGASSSAILVAGPKLHSYDIVETPEARRLAEAAGESWEYRIQDSRAAPVIPCDLLFVDSLHTYGQVDAELSRHADAVGRLIVFHDTLTFGSVGADGETGRQLWTYDAGRSVPAEALGIRPAIDRLMIRDPTWKIRAHYTDSHGLLVLERARG